MKPSAYQQAVYDFVADGVGSGAVNAVAGSGKTTTAVHMVKCFDPLDHGAFMAFNSHIAEELTSRLGGVCPAMTYNAFGWRAILKARGKSKPRLDKDKTQNLLRYQVLDELKNDEDRKWYYKWNRTIVRLMSLVKAADVHRIDDVMVAALLASERHAIELPPEGWQIRFADLWHRSVSDLSRMDFDDQKYMAQHLQVELEKYDYLVIDEYQDTCEVEANLLRRACPSGRTIAVGDPDQSIYSFKGTTPDAMAAFVRERQAKELPLSICYRCSKAVVAEAAKFVPRIEAWENARTGAVDEIDTADFESRVRVGDFILCRVTSDLVRSCLSFLKRGRPAYVQGREIGNQLISFIDSRAKNDHQNAFDFYHELNAYQGERTAELELMDRQSAIAYLTDQCDTVKALIADVKTVGDVKKKIEKLFADKAEGLRHLTIHKSKGLETEGDAYLIAPEKLPHPRSKQPWQKEEEVRLEYVGVTRAKEGFYRVRSEE
jgi:DNA helicase-2/ATP-dependent DNA helicase PcrA